MIPLSARAREYAEQFKNAELHKDQLAAFARDAFTAGYQARVSDEGWRPMTDNPFPWEHTDVIVAAFYKPDLPKFLTQVFRCKCAEHGAYFSKDTSFVSLNEEGWIPFAWRIDDVPARDDAKLPPMWTDYLTEAAPSK